VTRALSLVARQCIGCLFGQSLEPAQVELLGRDVDDVAGCSRFDSRGWAERLSQFRDLPLHLRDGRDRWRTGIEVFDEPLDGDDAVCVQQEDRECRALLEPAECQRACPVHDFQRTQDPELQHLRGR
jgi:hypothetical protein